MSNPLTRYHQATGSWPAAVLLFQIGYWWPKAKIRFGGSAWIAKPAKAWCAETNLTPKEYKSAVALLRQRDLVVTDQRPFGGKLITHLRLTAQGEALVVPQGTSATEAVVPAGTSTMSPGGPPIKGSKTENYEKQDKHGVLAHATPIGDSDSNKDSGKGMKKDGKGSPMKAADVQAKLHKPNYLEGLWKEIVAEIENVFVPSLTAKQLGQLKQFADKCPEDATGSCAKDVLEHSLRHWLVLTETAKSHAGLYKVPASPDVGFLLKHVGVAVKLWQKAVSAPKFEPTAPVQLIAQKPPEPEEPLPTAKEAYDFFFGGQG